MSLKTGVEGDIISKVLKNLAASEPITTILGAVLAAVVASKINYSLLLQGDSTQIASVITAIITALLGYYTNNKSLVKQQPPTGN
jgi:uncharacterized protein YacL